MKRAEALKLTAALVLLSGAAWLYWQFTGRGAPGELGFFYDVSARRIFEGPRTAAPPIRGVDGPDEDGFRALVISTNGRPDDRNSWQVAYLERFSPELKRATEEAQATGNPLAMGRLEAQAHRFVRRLDATEWYAMNSTEGEEVLNSWTRPSPGGVTPVPCSP